jgi:predicted permease
MEVLLRDVRYAVRQLVKTPTFTAVAVLTLALGTGANTAIFSAVDAVLLRPLPYPESDRLYEVTARTGNGLRFGVSYPDLLDLRALSRDFTGVAAFSTQRYNLTGAGDPREVRAAFATANLFEVLGVSPVIGHPFGPAQEQDPVAMLGYEIWASAFGRDPAILGKAIALDGKSYTIVGVMPPGFHFPDEQVEVWTPIGGIRAAEPEALTNRDFHALNAVARLTATGTAAGVAGDLDVLSKRIAAMERNDSAPRRIIAMGGMQGPPGGAGGGPRLGAASATTASFAAQPLRDVAIGDVSQRLWVLLGAVGLVLLIACVNAANLLLARATGRGREMAIRRAIGASRARLIRQLLTESVLLALVAAGLGLLFAMWGLDGLLALWPNALPRSGEVRLDGRVLGFTAGLAIVTGILFGLAPALRATAPDIEEALREETPGAVSGGGRGRRRLQHALVVTEVALALVLLVGAGLLVRSFIALNQVDPGFDPRDVLAARIRLTPARYESGTQQKQFFESVEAALRTRPDVVSAALSVTLPLSGALRIVAFDPHPIRADYPEPIFVSEMTVVSPYYFATMGIPVRLGRSFAAEDRAGAPRVAVISSRFAKALWPDADPIGRVFPLGGPRGPSGPVTVIGVVDDLRSGTLEEPGTRPALYLSSAQEDGQDQMWIVARSRTGSPLKLAGAIRDAVRLADPEQPIGDLVTMEQLIGRQTAARRFTTTLLGVFALLAVGLALVGIYGVTSYAVAQRQRELGIRLALGARPGDVVRLLVNEGLMRVAIGVGLGIGVALIATRTLASLLFGVSPQDGTTLVATVALLGGVGLGATWLPARRAARADPMVTLRAE